MVYKKNLRFYKCNYKNKQIQNEIQTYEIFKNKTILLYTISVFIIFFQTKLNVHENDIINKEIGFPIDTNTANIYEIEQMATLIKYIKKTYSPWDTIKHYSTKKLISHIIKFIQKNILNPPTNQVLLTSNINNLIINKQKWLTTKSFKKNTESKLQTKKVSSLLSNRIDTVTSQFLDNLWIHIYRRDKKQRQHISIIQSKINQFIFLHKLQMIKLIENDMNKVLVISSDKLIKKSHHTDTLSSLNKLHEIQNKVYKLNLGSKSRTM